MTFRILINPGAKDWTWSDPDPSTLPSSDISPVLAFHQTLPNYAPSPLRPLPALARSLGLGHVLLKDESRRFSLPSFKILGASWAVHRALAGHSGPGGIVTCTAGNWGRAVARMAGNLHMPAKVFVSELMPMATRDAIAAEGAEVVAVPGSYDDSLVAARDAAARGDGLLVLDVAMEGYEEIPKVRFGLTVQHAGGVV